MPFPFPSLAIITMSLLLVLYLLPTCDPSRNPLTLMLDGLHPSVEGRGVVALSAGVDLKRTNYGEMDIPISSV